MTVHWPLVIIALLPEPNPTLDFEIQLNTTSVAILPAGSPAPRSHPGRLTALLSPNRTSLAMKYRQMLLKLATSPGPALYLGSSIPLQLLSGCFSILLKPPPSSFPPTSYRSLPQNPWTTLLLKSRDVAVGCGWCSLEQEPCFPGMCFLW